MAERIINVNDTEQIINLFGTYDEKYKYDSETV